jgi:uncharacterized membrane protein HdeD (DUF308 family)
MLLHALARNWWLLLLRGIAAIVFGLLAFAWPGLTLLALVLLYGGYALADGVISLVTVFASGSGGPARWWLIVAGVLGLAAGVATLFWPGMTALVLIMFIGLWAVAHGIFEIVGAIQLRKEINNEWMLVAGGVLSVLFGLAVLVAPGAGALALVWLVGAYAVIFGALMVGLSLRLRRFHAAAAA